MQLQFRIDDNNFIAVNLTLSANDSNNSEHRPEVSAAVVVDSKLSDLSDVELLDLAGQALDYIQSEVSPAAKSPSGDWFTNEWLPACK